MNTSPESSPRLLLTEVTVKQVFVDGDDRATQVITTLEVEDFKWTESRKVYRLLSSGGELCEELIPDPRSTFHMEGSCKSSKQETAGWLPEKGACPHPGK